MMRTVVEWISPERAAKLLANQILNRDVNQSKVVAIADAITKGLFILTHQGIAISLDGRLLDGQHRLLACILAQKSIEITVTYDCDSATFQFLDQGTIRTTAGILSTLGYEATKHLAAIARQVVLFKQGKSGSNDPVIPVEVTAFVKANREALDYSVRVTGNVRRYPAVLGAVHFIFSTLPLSGALAKADAFIETFRDGLGIESKTNPIYQLKKKLDNRPAGISFMHRDVLAWTFKAMNAHFNGEELRSLTPRASESQSRYTVKVYGYGA